MSLSIPMDILLFPQSRGRVIERSAGAGGGPAGYLGADGTARPGNPPPAYHGCGAGLGRGQPASSASASADGNRLAGVLGGHQLTCRKRPGQGVARWGKRACPGWVVGARGVVGEVEVEDQPAVVAAEVGAFDRVEEVAAPAVG